MASAETTDEYTVDRKLSDIFEEAYHLYYSFESCNEPTNSSGFQVKIKKCMALFEDATRLVSICGLFSSNESYEEVNTNDLKYLLLPFFLGQLSQKLCGDDRHNIVEVSEVYFGDFLKRCEEYGLNESGKERTVATTGDNAAGEYALLARAMQKRNSKLEQFRQKKELEEQIKQLKIVMEREHVDDDIKREFYIKLLKASVMEAHAEMASIAQEKQILRYQKDMRHDNPEFERKAPRRPVQPLKPIIITKDAAQKAIYGLGYPSMPTMTVSEFYDQRVRDGIFPDPSKVQDPNSLQARAMRGDTADLDEQEDIENERRQEIDDDEFVARARAKDDYKDEHRRGEGNRYNRS